MKRFYFFMFFLITIVSCSDEKDCCPTGPIEDDVVIPLSIYEKVYGVTSQIFIQDGYVYINTNGVPDHKSPYFPLDHVLYEAYDGSNPFVNNWNKNPNGITTLNLRFKIPISPKKASSSTPTSMGSYAPAVVSLTAAGGMPPAPTSAVMSNARPPTDSLRPAGNVRKDNQGLQGPPMECTR